MKYKILYKCFGW